MRVRTNSWRFPYCSPCLGHVSAWPAPIGSGGVLFGLMTCGGWLLVDYLMRESDRKRALAACSASCASVTQAVHFVGWEGNIQAFDFVSGAYAVDFALANAKRLINVSPDLHAALVQAEAVRQQALAADVRREHERALEARRNHPAVIEQEFQQCLAKIELGRTPAARRAALQAGLCVLESRPAQQQRLTVEASRVEVEAALAKADGLKSMAAKRRVLAEALQGLRNDHIADALQATQIRWLEEALSELDGGQARDIRAV